MSLTWPLQKSGSSSEAVQILQYLLRAHGHTVAVDGMFESATESAVRAFQASAGLMVDGTVGDRTWPKVVVVIRKGDRGEKGDAVRAVQNQANRRTHDVLESMPVDGFFGRQTDAWVRDFQRAAGIPVDGVVGLLTWNHLVSHPAGSHPAGSQPAGIPVGTAP